MTDPNSPRFPAQHLSHSLSQPPSNPQVELAKERNRAAAERTLMAWIRTSLALISFGFGIDQIVAAIRSTFGGTSEVPRLSRLLGLSFIALGTFAMLVAIQQHQQELRHIQQPNYSYRPRRSLGLMVATALVVIGLAAFIGILVKSQS
ncbi:MAG TPA: DUF202 domain-containing protein [Allocoleopsis sp.]